MTKGKKIEAILTAKSNIDDIQFINEISQHVPFDKQSVLNRLTVPEINVLYRRFVTTNSAVAARGTSPNTNPAPAPAPAPPPAPASAPVPARARARAPASTKTDFDILYSRGRILKKAIEDTRFIENDIFTLERKEYRIDSYLTERESSVMYIGTNISNKEKVFIKVQPRSSKTIFQITTEEHILTHLERNKCDQLSQKRIAYGVYSSDKHPAQRYILVTSLHGKDLTSLSPIQDMNELKQTMKSAIDAIESIHKCGILHRDIKHENLVFEKYTEKKGNVFIIDYGIAEAILDIKGNRKQSKGKVEGSPLYMSINQHDGKNPDFMDDIQAIAYTMKDLVNGLPWRNSGKTIEQIGQLKKQMLNDYENRIPISNNLDRTVAKIIKYTHDATPSPTTYNPKYYKDVKNIINEL